MDIWPYIMQTQTLDPSSWIDASVHIEFLMKHIDAHPDWNWRWDIISHHPPHIVIPLLINYAHKPWNWVALSRNKAIVKACIKQHPDWNWDWDHINAKFVGSGWVVV